MLITLEGIDGSGKTTLYKGLKERLSDLNPVFTHEPGSYISGYVRDSISNGDAMVEATLFVTDHAVHLATVVRPALNEGRLVISDRYSDSRFAYQQISLEGIHPNPKEFLKAVHKGWSIKPDMTILLLINPKDSLSRLKSRKVIDHFEREEFLEKVHRNYLEMAKEEPERFLMVDATLNPDIILDFVEKRIRMAVGC